MTIAQAMVNFRDPMTKALQATYCDLTLTFKHITVAKSTFKMQNKITAERKCGIELNKLLLLF